MKKPIEVKIPTNPKDLRIRHFASMALMPQKEIMYGDEGVYFLSSFTGVRYHKLMDFRVDDIRVMIATARATLSKMKLTSKLPERVTFAGTSYVLVDPKKVGIGWHIDFNHGNKNSWITKDPVRLSCMFYLQEGLNYSDVDENDNIKFPIDSRYEIFKEHFPLELFMPCCDFFLKRSLNSIRKSMVIEIVRNSKSKREAIGSVVKMINPLHGKKLSSQS